MTTRIDGSPELLDAANANYTAALTDLHRQEVIATLRNRTGLHYASVGAERTGPNVVVFDGKVVGETRTTSPGVLHDWYAVGQDGREIGPFTTARAAAASLIKA
ncbi:hypothetical protein ACFV2I_34585 [Streptomyces microflavus]|uniref:hypothetical protein n=1 Tax=Streptomyces microflavus TaxID=1919 RepID=UPI0036B600B4